MASIEQRNGGYRVRWRDPDGRARTKQCPNRKTAKLVAADIEKRVAQGLPGLAPRSDPLEATEAIAAYLDFRAAMGSEQTVRTYEHILCAFVDYARLGRPRLYLTDMPHTMIERWFAMLAKRDRPKHNTRIQYCSVVSRFWEWSARRYPGRVAPFVKPEMPRKLRRKKVAPSWEEMDACIIAARQGAASPRRKPQDRDWVERMLTIMRFTGLRVRQTSLLNWEDFDLERGLLHVPAETEKTRVGRIIPISQHLIDYLVRIEPGEGRLFRRAWVPEAKWVNRCWRAAGVREAIHGWHAFRRGFETGLLGPLGVDLVRVRLLIGHSSGVDDSYIDAAGLDLRGAVELVPPIRDVSLAVADDPMSRGHTDYHERVGTSAIAKTGTHQGHILVSKPVP